MKIYTKSGDTGETSTMSGRRLSKADMLVEAYGTVDELNAHIGHLYDLLSTTNRDDIRSQLYIIQHLLFNIGAILASDGVNYDNKPKLTLDNISDLESWIDDMDKILKPLQHFILPSGHVLISNTHICRTICRRAERRVVEISHDQRDIIIIYLNRLSDFLFVLSRYIAHKENAEETIWKKDVS
jgi:cob(I)alamin adenosyltransferase